MIAVTNLRRRQFLSAGGGLLLSAVWRKPVQAADTVEITMSGSPNGSKVWFQPTGVHIQPGQIIRWINLDKGNAHTATAYHPDNGKPRRMPVEAVSWDSGYLMPGQAFEITFDVPGVYDYFCIPHEQAGMAGRIVVGQPDGTTVSEWDNDQALPAAVLAQLPDVSAILEQGQVD